MKYRIINIVVFIVLTLSISSCASFSKDVISTNLNPKTYSELKQIDGKYKIYTDSDSLKTNIYETLLGVWWNSKKHKLDLDSNNKYFTELEMISENELKLSVYENGVEIKSGIVKGKLKNGMFYLKQNLSVSGIPYVFGTFTNDKKRIILKNNSILIERINHEFGAVAVIFTAGFKYEKILEFERM
ncbi:MAG: hypothetical protein U1C58_12970 [Flavobacteriaceae bacterium]|nr:hypothetical protein [Flavobacteriaceae bacterium]